MLNYWKETYERTEEELLTAVRLYRLVINLAFAKSRQNILNRALSPFFASETSRVVQTKALRNFSRCLSFFDRYEDEESARETFQQFLDSHDLPKGTAQRGIKRSIDSEEYVLLIDFHRCMAKHLERSGKLFDLRNVCHDLINYLMLCDTLEFGFRDDKLNKLATHLFLVQEDEFFSNGFVYDFFVYDRLTIAANQASFIVCYKDRLSTWTFKEKSDADAHCRDGERTVYAL